MLGAAVGTGLGAVVAACTSSTSPTKPTGTTATSGSATGSSAPSTTTHPATKPIASPSTTRAPADYTKLSHELSRPVLRPGQNGFASTAQLYNPRFDRAAAPAAVARCAEEKDVVNCVRFAAATGVPFALRGGGHSYGGWSRLPGLVADLRPLSSVAVDTSAGVARIGAGAQLIDVYEALGARGVALAGGSCPTVGITGLALGGGLGVLNRAYGLTCDAIRSVRIVTADGNARTVDPGHDPDLFWALRGGGGGSFGAVTSLTMAVRPAPTVHIYYLAFDYAHAAQVVDAWQRWVPSRPKQLWTTCKLLADVAHGRMLCVVAGTWIGSPGSLDGQLSSLLRGLPSPTSRSSDTLPYAQAMLFEAGCSTGSSASSCVSHALAPAQRQAFAASSSIVDAAMPSAAIDAGVEQARAGMEVPGVIEAGVSFDALGGAVADVAPAATAVAFRHALATAQYTATWASGQTPPAAFDRYIHSFRQTMTRWLGTGAYVNYADAGIANWGQAYWGENYARLQQVKKQYDPHQLFTFAQAVRPA